MSIFGGLPYFSALVEATTGRFKNLSSTTPINAPGYLLDGVSIAPTVEQTLTDGATITPDFATGVDFVVTLGGNRVLGNPTNVVAGKRGRIRIVQDGTGSRTLTYGTNYEFEDAGAPTLSTGAADEDVLYYDCISSTRILCLFVGNIG